VGVCVFVKFLQVCALYGGELYVAFFIFSEPVSMCIICCLVLRWFVPFSEPVMAYLMSVLLTVQYTSIEARFEPILCHCKVSLLYLTQLKLVFLSIV
jgi:hypothetical protein